MSSSFRLSWCTHLVSIVPGRLARREYDGRQVVGEVAECLENNEFRKDDDERDDPDDDDHGASSTWRRLEVERVTNGVVAFHGDDSQRQNRHRHQHTLHVHVTCIISLQCKILVTLSYCLTVLW